MKNILNENSHTFNIKTIKNVISIHTAKTEYNKIVLILQLEDETKDWHEINFMNDQIVVTK